MQQIYTAVPSSSYFQQISMFLLVILFEIIKKKSIEKIVVILSYFILYNFVVYIYKFYDFVVDFSLKDYEFSTDFSKVNQNLRELENNYIKIY